MKTQGVVPITDVLTTPNMILTNDWIDQSVCSVPARNIFANNTDTARAGPGAVPGAGTGEGPDAGPGAGP